MTGLKAAPAPVANLRDAKKRQAALKQAESEGKTRHPADKRAPAKKVAEPAEKTR